MARTVLPRQWSVPNQLADFARRITSLEKLALSLAPRSAVRDSGWVTVPIVHPDFRVYVAPTTAPKVRRVGNMVEFVGALGSDSVLDSATISEVMHIPEGFRPGGDYSRVYICQGSGSNRWAMTVAAANATSVGRVDLGRYGPGASGTNTWSPFAVTWMVDQPWPS